MKIRLKVFLLSFQIVLSLVMHASSQTLKSGFLSHDPSIIQDPALENGVQATINGQEMVFYSNLELQTSEEETSAAQAKSLGAKTFGKFNGFNVVQKNTGGTLSSKSREGLSKAPRNFVLYNKSKKMFEVTSGVIQIEVKAGYESDDLGNNKDARTTLRSNRFHILVPNNRSDFINLYTQLQNDPRVEKTHLLFTPPPKEPM